LKGVGKLLSRSFLTKNVSPRINRSHVALGTPQPIFLCRKEAQRKIDQKETPIRGVSRSAERAKGYSPLTSQAFEKA